jgi:hypothetical protein
MLDLSDLSRLDDFQLKWLTMGWRAQLARRKRPVTPQLQARLETTLPLLLAECERRGLDASWTVYRRLRAEAEDKSKQLPPAKRTAAEALRALEAAVDAYRG